MTDILVGKVIKAEDFPVTVTTSDTTTLSNITSTTFIAGTPAVSVTFTAPTSGRVLLTVGSGMKDDAGANRVHVAPQIRLTNSGGTVVLAADVSSRGVGSPGESISYCYFSRTTLLEGLTPGQVYFAQTMHKVSGGTTADITARDITVEPTT